MKRIDRKQEADTQRDTKQEKQTHLSGTVDVESGQALGILHQVLMQAELAEQVFSVHRFPCGIKILDDHAGSLLRIRTDYLFGQQHADHQDDGHEHYRQTADPLQDFKPSKISDQRNSPEDAQRNRTPPRHFKVPETLQQMHEGKKHHAPQDREKPFTPFDERTSHKSLAIQLPV